VVLNTSPSYIKLPAETLEGSLTNRQIFHSLTSKVSRKVSSKIIQRCVPAIFNERDKLPELETCTSAQSKIERCFVLTQIFRKERSSAILPRWQRRHSVWTKGEDTGIEVDRANNWKQAKNPDYSLITTEGKELTLVQCTRYGTAKGATSRHNELFLRQIVIFKQKETAK